MKRKCLTSLLIICMSFALCACGDKTTTEPSKDTVVSESESEESIVETEEMKESENDESTEEIVESTTEEPEIEETDIVEEVIDESEENIIEEEIIIEGYEGKIITYKNLDGYYNDCVSQSAFCTISPKDENGMYHVVISWVKGDMEHDTWEMNLQHDTETNRFYYTDCVYSKSKANDIGVKEVTVQYENGSGFFKISNDRTTLLWTGAQEKECKECIFEPLEMD